MPAFGESQLIKKPHQQLAYTEEQIQEFAMCADPLIGPHVFLTKFFHVQHPIKGKLLYQPFPYQDRLIEAYHNHRKVVAMLPRQCGKCLSEEINITVRNRRGEVYVIPIGVFYEYERAKRDGTELPHISVYRQTGA